MTQPEEDLSDQADERMGIEVRRDGIKAYLQESGIYQQLVKAMVRLYHGRDDPSVEQGIVGLKAGLGASDEEVASIKERIDAAKETNAEKADLVKELNHELSALRGYSFEELLAFREILRGEMKEEPVPDPPLIPMQNCMSSWLKAHSLLRHEIKTKFESTGFVKFNLLVPFIPPFLMSDDVKEQVESEKLEWKEVVIPDLDDRGKQVMVEALDAEGNQMMMADEEGNEIPIPAKAQTKKYYFNRANGYTTWVRPTVLGADLDMTEEEKEAEMAKKAAEGVASFKYELFDFVDVQKDDNWTRKTHIVEKKGKGKKKKEKIKVEVSEGGYEPGYVVAQNPDGTYDVSSGRREESVFSQEMVTSFDEDGNEFEKEIDVEHIGNIVFFKSITDKVMKPWGNLKLPSANMQEVKKKVRETFMKEHYISIGCKASTPREIKKEQTTNLNKFIKELKKMRLLVKDLYWSEKEKVEKALQAKKPIIRKEHYKKLNKRLKEIGLNKQFRKKIACALKLLDTPQKQMKDRLPKILQSLYGAGVMGKHGWIGDDGGLKEEWCFVKEVEEDDLEGTEEAKINALKAGEEWDKKTVKKKYYKKVEGDDYKKVMATDMGQIIHSIFDDDFEKFANELSYKLQGIAAWEDWIDSVDTFKDNIAVGFEDWMGELSAAQAKKAKEEADQARRDAAAKYPEDEEGDPATFESYWQRNEEEDPETVESLWDQYYKKQEGEGMDVVEEDDTWDVFDQVTDCYLGFEATKGEADARASKALPPGEAKSDPFSIKFDVSVENGGVPKMQAHIPRDKVPMNKGTFLKWIKALYEEPGCSTKRLQHIWLIKEAIGLPHP